MGLSAEYEGWQEALAREVFDDVMESPVALFVDDDELSRIMESEAGFLTTDLAVTVRGVLDIDRPRQMFARVLEAQEAWVQEESVDPPPTLPVLALSVLAATRMSRDRQIAQNNYYYPLARLLLPAGSEEQLLALRDEMREGAYLPVTGMWEALDSWIQKLEGLAGLSTIRSGHFTRIGYALSQALLRRSDRAVLTQFFDDLQVFELGAPPTESLMELLTMWAARPRGLSDAFVAAVRSPDLSQLIAPSVAAWAAKWDGRVITVEGLRRTRIRILVNMDEWSARWAIPALEGIEADALSGVVDGAPRAVSIARDDYSNLYRLEGAPPVAPHSLRHSFKLVGGSCAADFTAAEVIPFLEVPSGEGWLSTDSVAPYLEHLLAVRADLASAVEGVLQDAADPGWRSIRQGEHPLLPGFRLFRSVCFSDWQRVEAALADVPGLLRLALRPASSARPRLSDGLRVMREVHPRCYLTGGEPDLLIPYGDEPRFAETSLDGHVQSPPFLAAGFPIPLRPSGPLDPGEHVVRVDGESISFWVVETDQTRGDVPGSGSMGWNESHELTELPNPVLTRGAALSGPAGRAPWMARRGQNETWLLHSDGTCHSVEERPLPGGLLARTPGVIPYYFEVPSEDLSVWLVQLGAQWHLTPLNELAPSFAALDDPADSLWRRLAAGVRDESPLWASYVAEWRRCADR